MKRIGLVVLAISVVVLGSDLAGAQSLHIGGFGGSLGGIVVVPAVRPTVTTPPSSPTLGTGPGSPAGLAAPGSMGFPAPTAPVPTVPSPQVGPVHVPAATGGQ